MRQVLGWREALKYASVRVGSGVTALGLALGVAWARLSEEEQAAAMAAIGLEGVAATLAVAGVSFVLSRIMSFDRSRQADPPASEPVAKPAAKRPARKRAPAKSATR